MSSNEKSRDSKPASWIDVIELLYRNPKLSKLDLPQTTFIFLETNVQNPHYHARLSFTSVRPSSNSFYAIITPRDGRFNVKGAPLVEYFSTCHKVSKRNAAQPTNRYTYTAVSYHACPGQKLLFRSYIIVSRHFYEII